MANTNYRLSFFMLCLLISGSVWSQASEHMIALGNSSNPSNVPAGDVAMVEGAALSGIRQSNLCPALERKEWEKILRERGIQKTEEFLDGKIVQQNVSLGADYLLIITIQSFDVTEKSNNALGSKSADVVLPLNANIISVATGLVVHNKNIVVKESMSFTKDSPAYHSREDLKNAIKDKLARKIEWEFSVFMFEAFPPAISIVRVEELTKKGKPKTVICKTSVKLPDGVKLDVYTEEVIDLGDGDKDVRRKEVGKLKVLEVQSNKVVLCDIKDGTDEIEALLPGKTPLKCRVNFETSYFENMNPFRKKPGY